jgi:hypothetical protein
MKGGIHMTSNQINYARLREEQRHNVETERQGRDTIVVNQRNAAANERQAAAAERNAGTNAINAATRQAELQESARYHANSLLLGQTQYVETARHNYTAEVLQQSYQDEVASHNSMMDSTALLQAQNESARIAETERHNKASERLEFLKNAASLLGGALKAGRAFGASSFGDRLLFDIG